MPGFRPAGWPSRTRSSPPANPPEGGLLPKILLDCDPGIDDAIMLLYLAAAVHAGEAELVAAGTVHGNIDSLTGALNTLRLLELTGVTGVPVAIGCARPLAQDVHLALNVHGTDGLGET